MMVQSAYMQAGLLTSQLNRISDEISESVGGLIPAKHITLPPPPFPAGNFVLHHLNVTGSTVGSINTGTIQNLDTHIQVAQQSGHGEVAEAVKALAQALLLDKELDGSVKAEVADNLDFLLAQTEVDPASRQKKGLLSAALAACERGLAASASLATLWQVLAPSLQALLT